MRQWPDKCSRNPSRDTPFLEVRTNFHVMTKFLSLRGSGARIALQCQPSDVRIERTCAIHASPAMPSSLQDAFPSLTSQSCLVLSTGRAIAKTGTIQQSPSTSLSPKLLNPKPEPIGRSAPEARNSEATCLRDLRRPCTTDHCRRGRSPRSRCPSHQNLSSL